jgi:sugar lactone lactonase YvrE
MNVLLRMHLPAIFLLLLLLGGCAGTNTIRGQLNYDLRPLDSRPEVFWPPAPDKPRFRYLGELIGQPNFEASAKSESILTTALKWIVGLFEDNVPLLLQRPQHGMVSDSGRIYVVDAGRNAVLAFDPNPPADEEDADNKDGHMLVWDLAAENTHFAAPVAVTTVWNGEIAVSDAKLGIVARLNNKGEPVGMLAPEELKRPTGLAFDRVRGLLFVADTVAHDIKVFDSSGKLVNTIGTPGEAAGQFNAPTHLAFADGHLYVTDTFNSRIQVFDADGRRLREFGERGLYVGNLMRPKGVALDDAGIVYVVESYYGQLLAYNKQSDLLLNINGSGLKGGEFRLPSGVWSDQKGRIFIADMFNGRVVVFQLINPSDG